VRGVAGTRTLPLRRGHPPGGDARSHQVLDDPRAQAPFQLAQPHMISAKRCAVASYLKRELCDSRLTALMAPFG
jgi:hypothetical protein